MTLAYTVWSERTVGVLVVGEAQDTNLKVSVVSTKYSEAQIFSKPPSFITV